MTTWTPKTQQGETWTIIGPQSRVFDPYVFDNKPVFDTGVTAGIWAVTVRQIETWTEA
jgi:hypothetical protein